MRSSPTFSAASALLMLLTGCVRSAPGPNASAVAAAVAGATPERSSWTVVLLADCSPSVDSLSKGMLADRLPAVWSAAVQGATCLRLSAFGERGALTPFDELAVPGPPDTVPVASVVIDRRRDTNIFTNFRDYELAQLRKRQRDANERLVAEYRRQMAEIFGRLGAFTASTRTTEPATCTPIGEVLQHHVDLLPAAGGRVVALTDGFDDSIAPDSIPVLYVPPGVELTMILLPKACYDGREQVERLLAMVTAWRRANPNIRVALASDVSPTWSAEMFPAPAAVHELAHAGRHDNGSVR